MNGTDHGQARHLRIAGIRINLHPSFLFLLILFSLMALGGGGSASDMALRLVIPLLLFLVVLAHELGHALCARRLGVNVVDILLTPLGGAARLEGQLTNPRAEVLIAAAGPAVNLILAGLISIPLILMHPDALPQNLNNATSFHEQDSFSWFSLLSAGCLFNIILGVVNLVPAFPTDGGRILRGLLSMRLGRLTATRIATRIGGYFGLLCVLSPFVVNGTLAWSLPLLGLFIMWSGFKERLMVEAQEGVLGGGGFRFGNINFPNHGGASPFEGAESAPGDRRAVDDPNVIDTHGSSRILDD
jgi:Zn-dependent protease